jgi:hypothetical protein
MCISKAPSSMAEKNEQERKQNATLYFADGGMRLSDVG